MYPYTGQLIITAIEHNYNNSSTISHKILQYFPVLLYIIITFMKSTLHKNN